MHHNCRIIKWTVTGLKRCVNFIAKISLARTLVQGVSYHNGALLSLNCTWFLIFLFRFSLLILVATAEQHINMIECDSV